MSNVIFEVYNGQPEYATFDTSDFLESRTENATRELSNGESETIQAQFERFADWCDFLGLFEYSSGFELGAKFMEYAGYTQHARDNTYNGENDLSSDFVWELWTENDYESDWIYCDVDTSVYVVYDHEGGDPRGNYAGPRFLRSTSSDYSVPVDFTASFYISEGIGNGGELDYYGCQRLDEKWQNGYSSNPFGQVENDVRKFIYVSEDKTYFWALLETGEIVKIYGCLPYAG